ncbi:Uncharacterised protein [Mycolicibacterium tokaiense]|jgi:hypothetical protein|uniref:Uncharacterized protein n=1 Tax=Mycolicibacterium tokaiense TaxID=39695 RepID=A0A379PKU2_9MYCO|nr:Uncharacterised protein [Mycolicibacterium tokaiense]
MAALPITATAAIPMQHARLATTRTVLIDFRCATPG